MGLDISSNISENYIEDMCFYVDEYIKEEHMPTFKRIIEVEGDVEKILTFTTTEHVLVRDEDIFPEALQKEKEGMLEQFLNRIRYCKEMLDILNNSETTFEDDAIVDKYGWIFDDDEVQDSRMGSYGTIHYGRKFADLISNFYSKNDMDLDNITRKFTKDEIISLLSQLEKESTTSYEGLYFDAFCNHSDCDGSYLPTQERLDFERGSSIQLLRELDTIWETGAIDCLKEIIGEIEQEYGEDIQYAPKEINAMYNLANTCDWVCRKMLYHAVTSVTHGEAIVFC